MNEREIQMLSLEKVKNELAQYHYRYADNVICGHTKSKVKWILPAGSVSVVAFEQATSYLFGFEYQGIHLFPVEVDWKIADHLFLPWEEITDFKMKTGLLENEMQIQTSGMKIAMKINKVVANNPWVKENIENLKASNYYYRK